MPVHIYKIKFSLLALLMIVTGSLQAATENKSSTNGDSLHQQRLLIRSVTWTKEKRDSLSSTWLATARSIDSWMSGEESSGRNKSRINIGIKQSFQKSGDHESELYIRGKLDIPNTKRKLKLFIDSETNDPSSLEDKRLNNHDQSFSTAGVSREHTTRNIKISNDVGIRFRLPMDPFYRFKARYLTNLNQQWKLGAEQKLWYYHSRGWGESSEIFFQRQISEQHSLRISTEAQYQKRYEEFEFGQFFTLNQSIEGNHWHAFTLGITGSSQPRPQTDSWYLSAHYKKLIYEDWLVFSANPKLRFPKDDNWKANPEIELRLDMYFQESN